MFLPSPIVSSSNYCKSPPDSLSLTHSPSSYFSSSSTSFKFRYQKTLLPASINDGRPTRNASRSTTTLSKRKRPAKLAIPVASFSFSDRVTPPLAALEDDWDEVEVDGDGYSVYCKKGKKDAVEDWFKDVVEFNGLHTQAFFGVFDGHGGSIARLCSRKS